jgi:hypothetical protein
VGAILGARRAVPRAVSRRDGVEEHDAPVRRVGSTDLSGATAKAPDRVASAPTLAEAPRPASPLAPLGREDRLDPAQGCWATSSPAALSLTGYSWDRFCATRYGVPDGNRHFVEATAYRSDAVEAPETSSPVHARSGDRVGCSVGDSGTPLPLPPHIHASPRVDPPRDAPDCPGIVTLLDGKRLSLALNPSWVGSTNGNRTAHRATSGVIACRRLAPWLATNRARSVPDTWVTVHSGSIDVTSPGQLTSTRMVG